MNFDGTFYYMIFAPHLRAFYCPVPKASCSTWKTVLRSSLQLPEAHRQLDLHNRWTNGLTYAWSMERYDMMEALFGPKAFYRFTVCRNPYARLVSAYRDKIVPEDTPIKEAVGRLKALYCAVNDLRPSEAMPFTFEMFVQAIGHDRPEMMDRHWQPQTMVTCVDLLRYDTIARLEDRATAFPAICERLGVDTALVGHLNQSHGSKDLRPLYTPAMIDIVRRVYSADFDRFGYDRDDIPAAA